MDAALREIQWLKRIMKELSDERETAMPDPKDDEAEEDDSELDRLLRHAMLLLRRKTSKQQFNSSTEEDTAEPTDEEEDDELLQRAVTLLRGRREESDAESEQEDEELDRLLRRAMELFAERRRRWLSIGEKENGTDLDVKTIKAATGSVSPGSTGTTDDEDEEDDELDNLLHRAMYVLRQRLREPSIVDEPIIDTEDVSDVCPLGWRKALRLQHLKGNKKRPRDETVSDERNKKRARCLIELQVDDEDELAETQTNESSSPGTIDYSIESREIDDGQSQVEQLHQEVQCIMTDRSDTVDEQTQTFEEPADENELETLRATNAKLEEENADLKQQLQQQKFDNISDAKMIELLQEQVQRLQQRELELMRAVSRCSAR